VDDRRAARQRAVDLLRSGALGADPLPAGFRIGDALPIESPKGRLHAWWAPVLDADRLDGYVTLRPDLTLLGFSRFGGNVGASAWLDPAAIRARARTVARAGESAGEAFLSFDGSPSRIAWAVELVHKKAGTSRTVFVAGEAVWERGLADDEVGGA
jgi:hypothetical protein